MSNLCCPACRPGASQCGQSLVLLLERSKINCQILDRSEKPDNLAVHFMLTSLCQCHPTEISRITNFHQHKLPSKMRSSRTQTQELTSYFNVRELNSSVTLDSCRLAAMPKLQAAIILYVTFEFTKMCWSTVPWKIERWIAMHIFSVFCVPLNPKDLVYRILTLWKMTTVIYFTVNAWTPPILQFQTLTH